MHNLETFLCTNNLQPLCTTGRGECTFVRRVVHHLDTSHPWTLECTRGAQVSCLKCKLLEDVHHLGTQVHKDLKCTSGAQPCSQRCISRFRAGLVNCECTGKFPSCVLQFFLLWVAYINDIYDIANQIHHS